MARMITGLLLKSYMTVARLMGAIDNKRKHAAKLKAAQRTPKVAVKHKLHEA